MNYDRNDYFRGVLAQRQALSLQDKILLSERRIIEWYERNNGKVYVAFSGGKDSQVLLHMVRKMYPDVKAVFNNTGLELPGIQKIVRSTENTVIITPQKDFRWVIENCGYPVVSKAVSVAVERYRSKHATQQTRDRILKGGMFGLKPNERFILDAPFKISARCCSYMKKNPNRNSPELANYYPYLGVRAEEGQLRSLMFRANGSCNNYKANKSYPMMFWKETDVLAYIGKHKIRMADEYYNGCTRTGCAFCMFGILIDRGERFKILRKMYPKLYEYCMEELKVREVLNFLMKNAFVCGQKYK